MLRQVPDLAVASVKMQGGSRISKLIGSAVYNDQNEKVGSVDDLIMKDGNRIVMAVVSVGGFLGIGNKLVAVPYDQLHVEMNKDEAKVTMPSASKDFTQFDVDLHLWRVTPRAPRGQRGWARISVEFFLAERGLGLELCPAGGW